MATATAEHPPEAPGQTPAATPRLAHMLPIALLGFAVRALVIWRYPAVFGGDPVLRMANPEYVFLSHQLPLPQFLVHLAHPLAPRGGPTLVRMIFAAVGALAGISFYLFATTAVAA